MPRRKPLIEHSSSVRVNPIDAKMATQLADILRDGNWLNVTHRHGWEPINA